MRYRHSKSQVLYEVVCHAIIESTLEAVVVYRSVNNPVEAWVRPIKEFYDGRFMPVAKEEVTS